jgi:hypothetical protein
MFHEDRERVLEQLKVAFLGKPILTLAAKVMPQGSGPSTESPMKSWLLDGMARPTTDKTAPALVAGSVLTMNLLAARIHTGGRAHTM